MATRFPLCCVLMELSEVLYARGTRLHLGWLPRESNQEADDLTNEVFQRFDLRRRVEVDFSALPWRVLPALTAQGAAFTEHTAELRAQAKAAGARGAAQCVIVRDGLWPFSLTRFT